MTLMRTDKHCFSLQFSDVLLDSVLDLYLLKLYRIPDPQDPKSGSFAHFGSLGSKIPGLLAKRPSKRPEKDPKNQFTGPDFEDPIQLYLGGGRSGQGRRRRP